MPLDIPEQFNIAHHFVDRPAEAHPEKLAIAGEAAQVRYRELREAVNRAGNALRASGCQAGDRVLIVLPDCQEFLAAFFGAAKIGALAVPVNAMTRREDYAHFLEDCRPKMAVVHETALVEFRAAAEKSRPQCGVVIVEGVNYKHGEQAWEEWIKRGSRILSAHPTAASDPAFILYTSGSSGKPKGAIHLHKDMLVTSQCFARIVLGISSSDIVFSASKLFFAYGLGNSMYFPLSVGAATVLCPDRPRPEKVVQVVRRFRPSLFFAVPTIYAAILRGVEEGLEADFSSVRCAVSAGEALPPEIFEHFRRRFGLTILEGIGSTEMLHMFMSNREGRVRAGSCGTLLPHYEAEILNDEDQAAADGEIGNLWIKGASAFSAYWNLPELTAAAKRDDWVATGDKFYRDPEGFYHYCGRADDMMKVSGLWVSPGEVENVLLNHSAVAEAAVVGARDAKGLTRPVAFVVTRDGALVRPELGREIQSFVRERLAPYKCPQRIHFVQELPKTATGKIQRFRLRSTAQL